MRCATTSPTCWVQPPGPPDAGHQLVGAQNLNTSGDLDSGNAELVGVELCGVQQLIVARHPRQRPHEAGAHDGPGGSYPHRQQYVTGSAPRGRRVTDLGLSAERPLPQPQHAVGWAKSRSSAAHIENPKGPDITTPNSTAGSRAAPALQEKEQEGKGLTCQAWRSCL